MNLDFKTLTNKILTGEANDEEIEHFNQLISSSSEFFIEYHRLKNRLEQVEKLKPIFDLNVENDWSFVSKNINKSEKIKTRLYRRNSGKITIIDTLIRIAAIIIIVSGLSFWLVKITTSASVKERFMVITVPYGAKNTVELADGTVVDLNSGSILKVSTNFNQSDRVVTLEGEAYFDVTKSDLPFIVETPTINIKVHGTKFNVKTYNEEKYVETTLLQGSLTVDEGKETKSKSFTLIPNQKLIFNKETENMVVLTIKSPIKSGQNNAQNFQGKIDIAKLEKNNQVPVIEISDEGEIENAVSWKKGLIVLNRDSLETLTTNLERMYDVKFEFESEDLKNFTLSGTLRKFTLEQLLDGLKVMLPIEYTIKDNTVKIYKAKKQPFNITN